MDGKRSAPSEHPDSPSEPPNSAASQIAVIGKAALVLDALLRQADGATPTEVADDLGLSRSTAFLLLLSLEHAGLVDRDPATSRYRLGLRLLVLGNAVRERLDLVRLAEPTLRELRDRVRQTVCLSVLDGWGAVCLHRLPGPDVDVDVPAWRTGQWLPLHSGAGPRALLAELTDAELETYLALDQRRRTRHGNLSHTDLRRMVLETRERGWSLNDEDITEGVSSLGAAVRPPIGGKPVYAVSVAGLAAGYRDDRLPQLANAVRTAAAQLAELLSGRSPDTAVESGPTDAATGASAHTGSPA